MAMFTLKSKHFFFKNAFSLLLVAALVLSSLPVSAAVAEQLNDFRTKVAELLFVNDLDIYIAGSTAGTVTGSVTLSPAPTAGTVTLTPTPTVAGTVTIKVTPKPTVAGTVTIKVTPKPTVAGTVSLSTGGGGGGGGGSASAPEPENLPEPEQAEPQEIEPVDNPESVSISVDMIADINGHWSADVVLDLVEAGIINGYKRADGKYDILPEKSVTRAEFIKMLALLSGDDLGRFEGVQAYKDVESNDWYSTFVAWSAEQGLVTGYEDGEFRPNNEISREEMAVLIERFSNTKNINLPGEDGDAELPFRDQTAIAEWAVESVRRLKNAGIITGDDEECANPKEKTKRGEAAKVLSELRNIVKDDSDK